MLLANDVSSFIKWKVFMLGWPSIFFKIKIGADKLLESEKTDLQFLENWSQNTFTIFYKPDFRNSQKPAFKKQQ
jgi:hypothetical protein